MHNKKPSIDGFLPRRANSQIGEHHVMNTRQARQTTPTRKEIQTGDDLHRPVVGTPRPDQRIDRQDIMDSLRELGEETEQQDSHKVSRRERKRLKQAQRTKGQRVRRRVVFIIVTLVVVAVLGVAGFLLYKAMNATGNVLNGNFLDIIQNKPLKEDTNGRSNFLIVGTSEDDPGHEAGYLTDSIMVMSIDQTKKNVFMFNIPRDLYVEYGMACTAGFKGKINSYFSCVDEGTDDAAEQKRLSQTQAFIGDIVGLDIQYGVHVNYTVMRDVVNAVGGSIDVTINSRNPLGVLDSNFDWKCGSTQAKRLKNCPPDGHFIQYPNGPVTLDAEHALYLAQARGDRAPTYGFEQSNFDRERNQQMIVMAIRDKALSAGTLTNVGAVTGLIDALGNNLRTNIETKEIRTIMDLAQNIKSENIQSLDFYSDDNRLFTTGPIPGAGSSVYPSAGVFDYSDIRAFVHKELTAEPFVKEEPHVSVFNGSGTVGTAQTLADTLTEKGFIVDLVDNAPDGSYQAVEIYQLTDKKPATAAKLKELYNVTIKTTTPPVSVVGETDFVIIIGDATVVQ